MTIWQRIITGGKRLFDLDRQAAALPADESCAPDPNDIGFTTAIIGLGVKMAKADGRVTDDEVMAFSRVFRSAPRHAASVQRVFRLAQQSVNGYQAYARKLGRKYAARPCLLEGVLDGLFMIATADGVVTEDELVYLETVSEAFGFSETTFRRIKASHLGPDHDDPYHILGVTHDAEFETIRRAYRKLMAENHPDTLTARGAPREFELAAHDKAAAITGAYARIRAQRGLITIN